MKNKRFIAGMTAAAMMASMISPLSVFADDGLTASLNTAERAIDAPSPDEEESQGVSANFFFQNLGGNWDWYSSPNENDGAVLKNNGDTGSVTWTDIASDIADISFYSPVESWESYPNFGIQFVALDLDDVGQSGTIDVEISDIVITYGNNKKLQLDDTSLTQELFVVQEDWGLSGREVTYSFKDEIKEKLGLDDEGYLAFLPTITGVNANVKRNGLVEDEPAFGRTAGLYIMNQGGDWEWLTPTDDSASITVEDYDSTVMISWNNVSDDLADYDLYYPVDEWEKVPALGISLIDEKFTKEGMDGHLNDLIENVTIEYGDDQVLELDSFTIAGDFTTVMENWGLEGRGINFDMSPLVINKLGLGTQSYIDFVSSIKSINVTIAFGQGTDEMVDTDPVYEVSNTGISFFFQNKGGGWNWFSPSKEESYAELDNDAESIRVQWVDAAEDIANFEFFYPEEEWETTPAIGIQFLDPAIDEVGKKGEIRSLVKNLTITYGDNEQVVLDDFRVDGELEGRMEEWGLDGNALNFDFSDAVKKKLGLSEKEYFDLLPTITDITADVTLENYIVPEIRAGFATGSWALQDRDTKADVYAGLNVIEFNPRSSNDIYEDNGISCMVFDVLDVLDKAEDLEIEVKAIIANGEWLDFDADKILTGDLEENNNYRIDIYNKYGGTTVDEKYDESVSPLDPSDLEFFDGEQILVYYTAKSNKLTKNPEDVTLPTRPAYIKDNNAHFYASEDSSYWLYIPLEELIGDTDPEDIESITFTSDTNFKVNRNAASDTDDYEFVSSDYVKEFTITPEDTILTEDHYDLSMFVETSPDAEHDVSWEITLKPEAERKPVITEDNVHFFGNSSNYSEAEITLEQLIEEVPSDKVSSITFKSDKPFSISYKNGRGKTETHEDITKLDLAKGSIDLSDEGFEMKMITKLDADAESDVSWTVKRSPDFVDYGVTIYGNNENYTSVSIPRSSILGDASPDDIGFAELSSENGNFNVRYRSTEGNIETFEDIVSTMLSPMAIDLSENGYYLEVSAKLGKNESAFIEWGVTPRSKVENCTAYLYGTSNDWAEVYVSREELIGDLDPSEVDKIIFRSDNEFTINQEGDTISGNDLTLEPDDIDFTSEGYSFTIGSKLSKNESSIVEWVVYRKPVIKNNTIHFYGNNDGVTSGQIPLNELLGKNSPEDIKSITFTSSDPFTISYATDNKGKTKEAKNVKSYKISAEDIELSENSYALGISAELDPGEESEVKWTIELNEKPVDKEEFDNDLSVFGSTDLKTKVDEKLDIKILKNGETVASGFANGDIKASLEAGDYQLVLGGGHYVEKTVPFTVSDKGAVTIDSSKLFVLKIGDITGDGKITSADALKAIAAAKKTTPIKDEYLAKVADINGDGDIKTNDALSLIRAAKKEINLWK